MITSEDFRSEYSGNDLADQFAYGFPVADKTHLLVTHVDADGNETTWVVDVDYTVNGVGSDDDAEWYITTPDPLPSGEDIVITPNFPLLQQTNFNNQGSYYQRAIESALDYLTIVCQQFREELDRAVKVPLGSGRDPDDVLADMDEAVEDAQTSATDADASALLAQNYAIKTDDYASGTDNSSKSWAVGGTGNGQPSLGDARAWASKTSAAVVTGEYSSKEWARGTQTRGAASGGASKDWATYTGGTVDNSEYSAKEYAQGTQSGAGGSSKDWAQKTSAAVTGSSYSSKEWAVGTQTRGAASGGCAKDWATYTGGTVDNSEYSAKKYAQDSATSAASAAASALAANAEGVRGYRSSTLSASDLTLAAGTDVLNQDITGTLAAAISVVGSTGGSPSAGQSFYVFLVNLVISGSNTLTFKSNTTALLTLSEAGTYNGAVKMIYTGSAWVARILDMNIQ